MERRRGRRVSKLRSRVATIEEGRVIQTFTEGFRTLADLERRGGGLSRISFGASDIFAASKKKREKKKREGYTAAQLLFVHHFRYRGEMMEEKGRHLYVCRH